jgi:hypothetical protein
VRCYRHRQPFWYLALAIIGAAVIPVWVCYVLTR